MEIQGNSMPHPAGHESHGSGHLCQRCGWAFPNSHPSAKHRRAHKKHCGKIQGFEPIDGSDAPVSPTGSTEEENEAFDRDRREKPEEPESEKLKAENEMDETKGIGEMVDEVSRVNHDDVSALEANDSAADKTLKLHHQPHADENQGHDMKNAADQLEDELQLGNNVSLCNSSTDATTEHEENSSCTHSVKSLVPVFPGEETPQTTVATSMITECTDFAVMDVNSVLPGDLAINNLNRAPESHMMDAHTAGGTGSKDMADESLVKIDVLDSKVSLPQGEQMDAAGQHSQNELLLCTESCHIEINTRGNLDFSTDDAEVEYLTDVVEDCIIEDNVKVNLTSSPVKSKMPTGEISEVSDPFCQRHEPTNSNFSLLYVGAEAGEEQEDHLGGKFVQVFQSETTSVDLGGSVNAIPSSIQLLKETENGTVIGQLNNKDNVYDEPDIDAPPIQLEVENESSSEGQEGCHKSLNEIMSGDQVIVADADDHPVFDTFGRASETSKLDNSQHIFYEETGVINSDIVGLYSQEISNKNSCQSDPEVDPDPTSDTSEPEMPFDDCKRGNELEMCEYLVPSTIHDSVLYSEDAFIHSDNSDNSGPYFDQLDLQKVTEERTTELAVCNHTEHSTSQTEAQTGHVEIESKLTEEPHGNLDQQKLQIKSLNINKPYPAELNQQKDLQGISTEPVVSDDTDHPGADTGVQIKHVDEETSPIEQPHEEPRVNEIYEVDMCHQDAQKSRLEEHLMDAQSSALVAVTLDNFKHSDIPEVVASGICDQSLHDGVIHTASGQQSDAVILATDASGDTNSQADSVEGRWGSVSVISSGYVNTEPFEAPSFMTLVDPAIRPRVFRLSPGKTRNEEIIEKVVSWNSGKPHTPLKNLLAEASFKAKKGLAMQDDEGPDAKTLGSNVGMDQFSSNRTGHKDWNSPARLVVEKRKVKGKSAWVPFMCCSHELK